MLKVTMLVLTVSSTIENRLSAVPYVISQKGVTSATKRHPQPGFKSCLLQS